MILEIAPPLEQDLALGLVELHEVHTGPVLKPVKVPLDGIPFLQLINCIAQLGVMCTFAKAAFNLIVYVVDKDIK